MYKIKVSNYIFNNIKLIYIFIIIGFSFSVVNAQKNTIKAGILIGKTPYIYKCSDDLGANLEYNYKITKKLSMQFSFGWIINKSNKSILSSLPQSFKYSEKEKTYFTDIDLLLNLYRISWYQIELGTGLSFIKNEFTYINKIDINENYIVTKVLKKSKNANKEMLNLVIQNNFSLTNNVVLCIKGIYRFHTNLFSPVDYEYVSRTITEKYSYGGIGIESGTFPFYNNYSLILSIGYKF